MKLLNFSFSALGQQTKQAHFFEEMAGIASRLLRA